MRSRATRGSSFSASGAVSTPISWGRSKTPSEERETAGPLHSVSRFPMAAARSSLLQSAAFRKKNSRRFPRRSSQNSCGQKISPIRTSSFARAVKNGFPDSSRGRECIASFSSPTLSGPPLRAKSLTVSSGSMANANGGSENRLPVVAVLYEDEHLLAVDKPAGLVVHADGRTKEPTLSDWVLEKYPKQKDVGGMHTLDSGRYAPRAGILHRLDRETSGVLLIAKDDETFYFLQRQFLDHSIEKTYNAFVAGELEKKEGLIELPIGRSRSDFRRWTTGDDARGTLRKAETAYRVLKHGEIGRASCRERG